MADLENKFPSWGEAGTLPSSGFFYEAGDQVEEQHFDALWHNVKTSFDRVNTAIRDRVRDITGDIVLDQGLSVSEGSGSREVDVTASSDGAYIDGQYSGPTSATTVTLSINESGSLRTDSIAVDVNGNVVKREGTTSPNSSVMKLAEVDVATDDTISAVREVRQARSRSFASETLDNDYVGTLQGDQWYDLTQDLVKNRVDGAWRTVAVDNYTGSEFNFSGNVNVNTNDIISDTQTIWDGSADHIPQTSLENASLDVTAGAGLNGGGSVSLGGSTELTVPQGGGSGLNADAVDGKHADAFADAGHDHNHDELTNVGSSDHHSRYTDSEAVAAVDGEISLGDADSVNGQTYSDIQNWVNNNADVPNANQADNANTLGGYYASEFADASHNHDGSYINGYLSNDQSDIDSNTLVNCWETIEVESDGFTIVDNNTIEVNEGGVYSVDYTCTLRQTTNENNAIMAAQVLINGADNFSHTGSSGYIRGTSGAGDIKSISNHSMHSLNAGDTIEVRVNRVSGDSEHDLTEASCAVQKIS